MDKKQQKKLLGNIIFLIAVLIAFFIILFSFHDIKDVYNIIVSIKFKYVIYLFITSILHISLVGLAIAIITTAIDSNVSFLDSFNIASTEHLFNAITPFASGGQPIQGYYYMKYGIDGDKTMSILVSNFVVYQTTAAVFSTLGIVLYISDIINLINKQVYLILIGFSINMIILVGIILLSTIPKAAKLFKVFIRWLAKIKPLTNIMEKAEVKLFDFVGEFQKSTKNLFKRKRVFLGSVSLRLLDLIVVNSIPIVIFLALGVNLDRSDYFFIIMMSMFAQTFMMWIPTPGASGAVEWTFTILFTGLLANSLIVPSMLLWRFFTYYFGIIAGLIFYVVVKKRGKKYENRLD